MCHSPLTSVCKPQFFFTFIKIIADNEAYSWKGEQLLTVKNNDNIWVNILKVFIKHKCLHPLTECLQRGSVSDVTPQTVPQTRRPTLKARSPNRSRIRLRTCQHVDLYPQQIEHLRMEADNVFEIRGCRLTADASKFFDKRYRQTVHVLQWRMRCVGTIG